MRLTEHFTLEEFTRSATAERLGIDNTPTLRDIENMRNLCEQVLEPLRKYARRAIVINSGYRCPDLNQAVGGCPYSLHQGGMAADIWVKNEKEGTRWVEWIRQNTDFDTCYLEQKGHTIWWIHVTCRPDLADNRKRWRYFKD